MAASACAVFPLGLGGQAIVPTGLFGEPGTVGYRVFPTDIDHGSVIVSPAPIIWPGMVLRITEAVELRIGHRITTQKAENDTQGDLVLGLLIIVRLHIMLRRPYPEAAGRNGLHDRAQTPARKPVANRADT